MSTLNFANIKNALLPEGVVKKIAVGGQTLWKAYDAEVEYLQSTGTQYIQISSTPSVGRKMVIDFSFEMNLASQDTMMYFYGTQLYYRNASGRVRVWNTKSAGDISIYNFGTRIMVELELTQSNTIVRAIGASSISTPLYYAGYCITIFSWANGQYPSASKLYNFKDYFNNVLVRDFIPVRIGTTGYLYDKVQGKLYGNSGTGSFTLGPDVRVL
jgi:hypothetical protein